jgi:23S rRNA pseudouridine955/2504/2580 synthase
LDAPVSGLILVALNEKIAGLVRAAFEKRTVEKKYLALLKGHLLNESGCWKSNTAKIKLKDHIHMANFGNIATITKYRLIREILWRNITLSLVELQPITGRTHQLRLHCSQNHVPIIGDGTYGDFNFNRQFQKLTGKDRVFLHSNEVCVHYRCGDLLKCFHAKSECQFLNYCLYALAE